MKEGRRGLDLGWGEIVWHGDDMYYVDHVDEYGITLKKLWQTRLPVGLGDIDSITETDVAMKNWDIDERINLFQEMSREAHKAVEFIDAEVERLKGLKG